jgi:hypothetical protein
MAVFPTLDFAQIEGRYPKAVKKITEWIFNQPELLSVTEDFIDSKDPEGSKKQFAALMIQMDPRKLYDIFDSFGLYVSVHSEPGAFNYYVGEKGKEGTESSFSAPSRHTAEVSAFHDAFEVLENQL